MYRLFFREIGTQAWHEGASFSDEMLTPDARDMLAERYARDGLETKFVHSETNEGDEK